MDNNNNNNIVINDGNQEHNILLDTPLKSTEQQELEDDAASKEWVKINGFGVCWDIVSYTLCVTLHFHELIQQMPDYVQKTSTQSLLKRGFVILLAIALQSSFFHRFGTPGMFMNRYLKLYVSKSITGKLLYLSMFLISILTTRIIIDYLSFIHENLGNANGKIFCEILAYMVIFFQSNLFTVHGPAAIVVFPIKIILDRHHPPHESTTFYGLKLCILLTLEIWIYIAASYEDKNYNHTAKVLAGDSEGNLMAHDVIIVTNWIIVPILKLCAFFIITVIGYTIIVYCILLPAVQLARRNRFVLPIHELHLE